MARLLDQPDAIFANGRTDTSLFAGQATAIVVEPTADLKSFSESDPLGEDFIGEVATLYSFDRKGRLIERSRTVETAIAGVVTTDRWIRDGYGQIVRGTQGEEEFYLNGVRESLTPGRDTTYRYDYEDTSVVIDKTDLRYINSDNDTDARFKQLVLSAEPRRQLVGNLTELYFDAAQTTRTYDANGDLLTETDVLGRTWTYHRDAKRRVDQLNGPLGYEETWVYDTVNSVPDVLKSHTDARGLVTTYEYGANRRIDKTTRQGASDDLTEVTTFSYDAAGNVDEILVEDGDGTDISTTAAAYDSLSRPISRTVTDSQFGELSRSSWTYDAAGRLIESTIGGGAGLGASSVTTTTYAYDSRGWQTAMTVTGTAVSQTTESIYFDNGAVKSITRPGASQIAYFYDPLLRTAWERASGVATTSGVTTNQVVETILDEFGRVVREENLLTGAVTTRDYDRQDRLTSETLESVVLDLSDAPGGSNVTTQYVYDAVGNVRQVHRDGLAATSTEYDALNRVIRSAVIAKGGGAIDYAFSDASSDIATIVEHRFTPTVTGGPDEYSHQSFTTTNTYDDFGRVLNTTDAGPATENRVTLYEYLRLGLTVEVTDRNSVATTSDRDAAGQVRKITNSDSSIRTLNYNNRGELTEDLLDFDGIGIGNTRFRRTLYEYDALGRQTAVIQAATFDQPTHDDDLIVDTSYIDSSPGQGAATAVSVTNPYFRADGAAPVTKNYFDSLGNVTRIEQPDPATGAAGGLVTSTTYEYSSAAHTVTVSTTDPTLRRSKEIQNAFGLTLTKFERVVGSSPQLTELVTFKYDEAFRPIEESTLREGSTRDDIVYQYALHSGEVSSVLKRDTLNGPTFTALQFTDSAGNVVRVDTPSSATGNSEHNITTMEYDGLGRLTLERTKVDYFTSSSSTTVAGQALSDRKWFHQGLVTIFWDRNGDVMVSAVDPVANEVHEFWIRQAALPSAFENDTTLAEVQATLANPTQPIPAQTYVVKKLNPDGTLQTATSTTLASANSVASSITTAFTYDEFGRVETETVSGTVDGKALARVVKNSDWSAIGVRTKLAVSADPAGNTSFSPIATYTQTPDHLGRVTSLSQELHQEIAPTTQMWIGSAPGIDKFAEFTYYGDGQLRSIERHKGPDATGAAAGYSFRVYDEATGRLKRIAHFKSESDAVFNGNSAPINAGNVAQHDRFFDASGRISQRTTKFFDASGGSLLDETLRYIYGAFGRLEKVERQTSPGTWTTISDPNYDASQNRIDPSGVIFGYDNRLLSQADHQFAYNREGRLTVEDWTVGIPGGGFVQRSILSAYDQAGRLIRTDDLSDGAVNATTWHVYDALGREAARGTQFGGSGPVTWEQFVGDGPSRLVEFDLSGPTAKISAMHLYAPNGELLATDRTNSGIPGSSTAAVWAYADLDGSVTSTATIDSFGAFDLFHQRFDAYGNPLTPTYGSSAAVLTEADRIWQGMRESGGSTLAYEAGSRDYRPDLARFTTPGIRSLSQPNAYLFQANDPLNKKPGIDWAKLEGDDPEGLGFLGRLTSRATGYSNAYTAGGVGRLQRWIYGDTLADSYQYNRFHTQGLWVGIGASIATGTYAATSLQAYQRANWLVKGATGWAVTGDVVGVAQSGLGLAQGTFTRMDLLGFAPTIGWSAAIFRRVVGIAAPTRTNAFFTDADPARKVMGPARISHSDEIAEMRRLMEAEGVEVIERSGTMAYGPSSRAGRPGQFIIDPDASYSAWMHEFRHFRDDRASAWDGMSNLMDANSRWSWELAAYAEEISLMRRLGRQDVVDELIKLRTKEWRNIFMPHLRK
nr:hypothetical protein [Caulifigura coniformis]